MKNKISYLSQYCNMIYDWHNNNIEIDDASEEQIEKMQELQAKAVEQSGLTLCELSLICMCREYKIFTKVNVYAKKIKLL